MATAAAHVSCVVTGVATAQKSSFFAGSSSLSMYGCSNGSRVCMAEWLPGNPRPSYLDGSAPGYVITLLSVVRNHFDWHDFDIECRLDDLLLC